MTDWTLRTSSWGGPLGGGHVYASITRRSDRQSFDVHDTLTEEWARELNDSDRFDDYDHLRAVGRPCGRFLSKQDALDAAVATFLDLSGPGDVLYHHLDYISSGPADPVAVNLTTTTTTTD